MKISVKGRYALAAVVDIARNSGSGGNVSVINISKTLGISKIYLEQVFAQLKKANILLSSKGSKGGYLLSRPPVKITAWDVLASLEATLAEHAENTVEENAPEIESAMKTLVFRPLDDAVMNFLSGITVQDLLDFSDKQKSGQAFMLNM